MNTRICRMLFASLVLPAGLALPACSTKLAAAPIPITIVFAELDPSAPVQHLYDKEGKPVDLGISSPITVHAMIDGVIDTGADPVQPGHLSMSFTIPGDDGKAFQAWTAARLEKGMAMIVDDQVLSRATIQSPLPASGMMHLPETIRSAALKDAVAKAPKR
jgi:preprotein translocase subunit SecD